MSVFTRVARGRLAAWLTVAAALVVAAVVFGVPRPDNPAPVSATGLDAAWQSTQVQRLQDQLPTSDVQPAIVVVSREGGKLFLQMPTFPKWEMGAYAEAELFLKTDKMTFAFVKDPAGSVTKVVVTEPNKTWEAARVR